MANNLLPMILIRTIIQLLQKGIAYRRIARELQLSRNTVKDYIKSLRSSNHSLEALQTLDDAALSALVYAGSKGQQPDSRREDFRLRLPYFKEELRRTGVTRLLLWQEYRKQYPAGYGYSQFCELLAQMGQIQNATMHFTHRPAEVMMVDFAGDLLHYANQQTGELVPCPVFVAVLPYSGYSFAIALPDARQTNVIKALNGCLQYLEGVPQSLKCDNMKQVVSKSCRYEPLFTDTLQQWALHNGITLMATRPAKPKDKASVENEVKLTYQRIYAPLRDRMFFSLNELNAAIQEQLSEHHRLPFQNKTYNRLQQFSAEEKPLLQPLPAHAFHIKHSVAAKVQRNYHITLGEDGHHYSVPFSFIGKTVTVVYDSDTVEIYFELGRIALHTRSYKKHGHTTLSEHMPESHRRYWEQKGWDCGYFLLEAEKIGPNCVLYIQGMLKVRQFAGQTYRSCLGILRLAKAYGTERLEAACKRALKGCNFSYRTVRNILMNNLDVLESAEQPCLFTMPAHDNLRGPEAYC
jgi:transposase